MDRGRLVRDGGAGQAAQQAPDGVAVHPRPGTGDQQRPVGASGQVGLHRSGGARGQGDAGGAPALAGDDQYLVAALGALMAIAA